MDFPLSTLGREGGVGGGEGEREGERRRKPEEQGLVSFLKRALIILDQGPTLMTSFNVIYILKAPSPNTIPIVIHNLNNPLSQLLNTQKNWC